MGRAREHTPHSHRSPDLPADMSAPYGFYTISDWAAVDALGSRDGWGRFFGLELRDYLGRFRNADTSFQSLNRRHVKSAARARCAAADD